MLEQLLMSLVSQFPYLSVIIATVGAMRLTVPVLMQALRMIAKQTATTDDDKALDRIERSPNYLKFLSILEWLTSIKISR